MANSMTGFGRGEFENENRKMIVEMRSVNPRYCEVNVRMPRIIGMMENDIRNYVKQELSRGKIDVFVTYEDHSEKSEKIKYNELLAEEYLSYFRQMSERFSLENDITVSNLSRYPEVLKLEEQDDDLEMLLEILKNALDEAVKRLISGREIEGEHLINDIGLKLMHMDELLLQIEKNSPLVVLAYKEKLQARLAELIDNVTIDETRLAMEAAMYAEKTCVDEEIVRLKGHIEHMRKTLSSKEAIGRKLDFLAQEMNREANTILSKANDLDISNLGIDLKTDIEKIREQIQNIE